MANEAVAGKPAVIKQEATNSTYARTAVVGGITASPIVLGSVIKYLFTVLVAFLPAWPMPDNDTCTNIAILIAAGGASWVSYSMRGTRPDRRSTDAQTDIQGG